MMRLFVLQLCLTMVEGSSDWSWMDSMQELWDVWSTRILVTLVFIGIFEYLQSNQQRALSPAPAAPPLQYDEQLKSRAVAPNPLLDSLQGEETNKNDSSPETTEPSTDDVAPAERELSSDVEDTQDIDDNAAEIGIEEDEDPKQEDDDNNDDDDDDSGEEIQQMNDAAAVIGVEEDEAPKEDDKDDDDAADNDDDKEEKIEEKNGETNEGKNEGKTEGKNEEKNEEKAIKNKLARTTRFQKRNPAPALKSNNPALIKATTNAHPGMAAFSYWYEVETSLFRIYTLGRRDDVEVVPPYVPHSYRGNVGVFLHVTNHTNIPIKVFWVDYKGKHMFKGNLKPDHVWTQTTYIDHPWVFEHADTQIPLLYYIPYRVIPTLPDVPTVESDDDQSTGRHQFSLVAPDPLSPHWIGIDDHVMPFPGTSYFTSPLRGMTWTLQQVSRMMSDAANAPELDKLYKYLTNIVKAPEQVKYRQIRIRSPSFAPIWQSPMRGLLLSVGFVEEHAYAELGCADQPLSRERVQELALLTYLLTQWKLKELESQSKSDSQVQQPEGADGFGRAGFGRAGQMNLP